ncbi:Karyopherin transporter, partial [Rhizopus stolonifer]
PFTLGSFDIQQFDSIVHSFYEGNNNTERQKAQVALTTFQSDPNAWQLVDHILEQSSSLQAKFIALGVLEEFIKVRWNALPMDQRLMMRNYIVKSIIDIASNESTLRSHTAYLNKLDLVLVQILKKDWPQYWPSFIQEIVDSSATSSSLCENNMKILKFLSEEVFDFSVDHMTLSKMTKLKNQMVNEFGTVFDLCKRVLSSPSNGIHLIHATLETLYRFISWIPIQFVYRQDLIQIIEANFRQATSPAQKNLALQCFTEIIGLNSVDTQQYSDIILNIYSIVYSEMVPFDTQVHDISDPFIETLAIFLTTILGKYRTLIESTESGSVYHALEYLLSVSRIPEREIWKICLEYWGKLAYDIVQDSNHGQSSPYQAILKELALVMVDNMVKPDDVLIIENDDGDISREFIKQSDTTVLSRSMRHVFSLLTSLDPVYIQTMIRDKLHPFQLNKTPAWSWNQLFHVCWAIGSISGAITEQQENEFLESIVLKDLVGLLPKEGTDSDQEWVVASCVLYIACQYPHFLKSHWDFTSFLLQKIVVYMQHEQLAIREMACDSFLKICQCCKEELVMPHQLSNGQNEVSALASFLSLLASIVVGLDAHQSSMVYEAMGTLISTSVDPLVQQQSIRLLMHMPNQTINQTLLGFDSTVQSLKTIIQVLRVNIAVCKPVGPIFKTQLQETIPMLTQCYELASQHINHHDAQVQLYHRIRKLILELLETFFLSHEKMDMQDQTMLFHLVRAILMDYRNCSDLSKREPTVLSLLTSLFEKIQDPIWPDLLEETIDIEFRSTLPMITANFVDYPEFRHEFYRLLRVLNRKCFLDLFQSSQLFQLMIDSMMWGTKHTVREISQMALQTCLDMINTVARMEDEDISSQFFETFYVRILTDILEVLVDPDCRNGFNYQSQLLSRMFELVQEGEIYTRLFDPNQVSDPLMSNVEFLQQYVLNLLCNAFPLLYKDQIEVLVMGMFEYSGDLQRFQNDIRDFLIDIREVGEASAGQQRDQEKINAELELLRQL